MECNPDSLRRISEALSVLDGFDLVSEREYKKITQRVKRWIRDSGGNPAELKAQAEGEPR